MSFLVFIVSTFAEIKLNNSGIIFLVYLHPIRRHRDGVVDVSLCTFQQRLSYISNKIPNKVTVLCRHYPIKERRDNASRAHERPNNFSVVLHQDVSMVLLHDVAQEGYSNIPKVSNHHGPLVRLYNVFELRHCNTLLVRLCDVFKLQCHDIPLVAFIQISNQTTNFTGIKW